MATAASPLISELNSLLASTDARFNSVVSSTSAELVGKLRDKYKRDEQLSHLKPIVIGLADLFNHPENCGPFRDFDSLIQFLARMLKQNKEDFELRLIGGELVKKTDFRSRSEVQERLAQRLCGALQLEQFGLILPVGRVLTNLVLNWSTDSEENFLLYCNQHMEDSLTCPYLTTPHLVIPVLDPCLLKMDTPNSIEVFSKLASKVRNLA